MGRSLAGSSRSAAAKPSHSDRARRRASRSLQRPGPRAEASSAWDRRTGPKEGGRRRRTWRRRAATRPPLARVPAPPPSCAMLIIAALQSFAPSLFCPHPVFVCFSLPFPLPKPQARNRLGLGQNPFQLPLSQCALTALSITCSWTLFHPSLFLPLLAAAGCFSVRWFLVR